MQFFWKCDHGFQTLNILSTSMWIAYASFMLVGVMVILHRIREGLCHIWVNDKDDLPR